jgi:hypothetical protein
VTHDDDPVRRLLIDAVPELRAPEDRLGRVADLVGRRRRRRWTAISAGAASLVLAVGLTLLIQPGGAPAPAGEASAPVATATPAGAPTTPPASAPPSVSSTSQQPVGMARPPGVAYRASAIPAGWAGVGTEQVSRTGAMPASYGVGAFRQVCQYSHMAPEDPVLGTSPLMVYAGNSAAGAHSTAASIAGSGNSTCWGGTADRSAYWTNALIDSRTGTPLAPTEFSVRYSANYPDPAQVQPMPAGLRLLSNQATWGCWDGTTTTYTRPTACPPGNPLVLNIWFPRCWNGTQLDSPDHHSHLAYPIGQRCPADHPVPIPQMEYHVLYAAPADGNLAAWRLSNDTSPGGAPVVGYGGFFEGWDPAIGQTWLDNCVRKPTTCESHLLGDGRVIEGRGDL